MQRCPRNRTIKIKNSSFDNKNVLKHRKVEKSILSGRFGDPYGRVTIIKQLLDEVEHDIMNYQNRGLCYLPKPKAEADNTDTRC